MKLPFGKRDDDDEYGDMDEFVKALMQGQGIPSNEPRKLSYSEFMRAMTDAMDELSKGVKRPSAQELYDEIAKSPWAGKMTMVQGSTPCCDLEANDGMIFITPNKRGIRKLAAELPEKVSRANVSIYCFDEHTADFTALNMEAEGLKKLMNALPAIIAEAERMRDLAVEIAAEDEDEKGTAYDHIYD